MLALSHSVLDLSHSVLDLLPVPQPIPLWTLEPSGAAEVSLPGGMGRAVRSHR